MLGNQRKQRQTRDGAVRREFRATAMEIRHVQFVVYGYDSERPEMIETALKQKLVINILKLFCAYNSSSMATIPSGLR